MARKTLAELKEELRSLQRTWNGRNGESTDRLKREICRVRNAIARKLTDEMYRDLGMTKVRGSLGGTYYE